MKFYLYTTTKRYSTTDAVVREFDSVESARAFFNDLCNGIEFCENQCGHESSVVATENHNGKNVTFVMESRLKSYILSTQTTLERIFGRSKYAPLEMIAMEKQIIEEATRREEEKMNTLMEEASEAEREAERLGIDVIEYLCSKM